MDIPERGLTLTAAAGRAIAAGTLGYVGLVARRPRKTARIPVVEEPTSSASATRRSSVAKPTAHSQPVDWLAG